jgi:hypothetical protein
MSIQNEGNFMMTNKQSKCVYAERLWCVSIVEIIIWMLDIRSHQISIPSNFSIGLYP